MIRTDLTGLRTRLAPTPSGYLHLGNAASFVLTWVMARAHNGHILLRIDDLDARRYRPEYLEDIFRTIEWLQIDYDEGPSGPTDFLSNFSQQLRKEQYQQRANQLLEAGHLYACSCSRRMIRKADSGGVYNGICRKKALDFFSDHIAWRVKVDNAREVEIQNWGHQNLIVDLQSTMGDFVVRQKNGQVAYQLASLTDDLLYEIDFVVRGADLLASTAAQLFLARQMETSNFINTRFFHHPLISDNDGQKLSKSAGAMAVRKSRKKAEIPEALFTRVVSWLKLPERPVGSVQELLQHYKEHN